MAVSGLFSYVFYRSMAAFELMLPVSGVFLFLRERRQRLKKRMGEEAGTKLLVPLFLLLFVVMIFIMVPAMITMG